MDLMDLYYANCGAVKTASMEKTAEEIQLEKVGAASRQVFEIALDDYLMNFAFTDLSR